jgi:hypothetical protein
MSEDSRVADRDILQALTTLEVNYWYEVDHNWGRNARAFYTPQGVFAIGNKTMAGPDAIADFYRWRESRGERVARHVVTNLRLGASQGARAKLECIMLLYAADGRPVLPSLPAIMIADVVSDCERDDDGKWRFVSHRLMPIFEGGVPATIPQN